MCLCLLAILIARLSLAVGSNRFQTTLRNLWHTDEELVLFQEGEHAIQYTVIISSNDDYQLGIPVVDVQSV